MGVQLPPSREARIVAWLQRLNGEYATFMRWLSAAGIIYSTVGGRADFFSGFVGLATLTFVIGKR